MCKKYLRLKSKQWGPSYKGGVLRRKSYGRNSQRLLSTVKSKIVAPRKQGSKDHLSCTRQSTTRMLLFQEKNSLTGQHNALVKTVISVKLMTLKLIVSSTPDVLSYLYLTMIYYEPAKGLTFIEILLVLILNYPFFTVQTSVQIVRSTFLVVVISTSTSDT